MAALSFWIVDMGMSMHVLFLREKDTRFQQMVAISEACEAAGIKRPRKVDEFFQGSTNHDEALTINASSALREYSGDMENGYELDVAKIPEGCVRIRFVASY